MIKIRQQDEKKSTAVSRKNCSNEKFKRFSKLTLAGKMQGFNHFISLLTDSHSIQISTHTKEERERRLCALWQKC